MNDKIPFFSVITPEHNSEKFMRTGLDSIRDQDFEDYQMIIVCDSCMDKTEEIAAEYIRPKTRDKLLKVDVGRAGLSRNAGLDVAEGEWILWMDDDDWYMPGAFGMIAEELKKQQNIDILAYNFAWKGMGIGRQSEKRIYPAIWCKAWKREFIGDNRFPDWIHTDDLGFTRKMTPGARIGFLNATLYYYNFMREGSVSDRIRNGEFDNNEIPEEFRDAAEGYERWLKSKEFKS